MNLFEDINRMRQMMGLNEETLSFEEFGLNEQLVGYEPGPFALFGHLFSKLYKAYLKGNLEKEYAILMNNDNVNSKMVRYFYDFIIDNDEYFQEQEKGVFTEQISEKESKKDFSPMIKKLLKPLIKRNKDIICDIEVTAPWNREDNDPDKSSDRYKVIVTFIGGPKTKYWPVTQFVRGKFNKIVDEVWQTIYGFLSEASDVYIEITHNCNKGEKEEESEGVGAYAAPAFEMKPDHVHFKHQYNEESELTEKCWAGYTQKGMKTMFGKRYPNCVKKTK